MAARPVLRVVRCAGVPVLRQLRLEEALLRAGTGSWAVLNDAAAPDPPTVVLGVSGKVRELVDVEAAVADGVRAVRRFSGGGTVLVDGGTALYGLVVARAHLPHVAPFPEPLMRWSAAVYAEALRVAAPSESGFALRAQDFALGARKFGGNAQSITKERWLHHTSVLWDYDEERMARYLRYPAKTPKYRAGRKHADFLTRLRDVVPDRAGFAGAMRHSLKAHGFTCVDVTLEEAEDEFLRLPHLSNTRMVDLENLEGER